MTDLSATAREWLPGWVMRDQLNARRNPCEARLARAAVNAPDILPPATRDPRQIGRTGQPDPVADMGEPANTPMSPPSGRPYGRRPDRPETGVSITPLTRFSWGRETGGSKQGVSRRLLPRTCTHHVLIAVTEGSARLVFPGLDHLLPAGSVTFIPAGTAFSLLQNQPVGGEVLTIPPAFLRLTGTILPRKVLTGTPKNDRFAAIRNHIHNLGQMPPPQGRAMPALAAQQLNQLALILPDLSQSGATGAMPADDPQTTRRLVERFLRMIHRDLGCGITVADFAQELHVTTGQLERACRFHRGRNPLQLIYDLRLERAVALLRAGQPAAQVACQLGYAGLPHMKRIFIAATGRKPEDFAAADIGAADMFRPRRDLAMPLPAVAAHP